MHDERSSEPAQLSALAAQLAALAPVAGIQRDQLMFAAGQRAAAQRLRMTNRFLASSTFSLAVLAVVLMVAPYWKATPLATRPMNQVAQSNGVAQSDSVAKSNAARSTEVISRSGEEDFAQVAGPTHFRLLQKYVGSDMHELDWQAAAVSIGAPNTSSDNGPATTTRGLLKSMLEPKPHPL